MRGRRRGRRIGGIAIAALFVAGVGAGLQVAQRFGSDQIIAAVESRLGAALGAPVSIGRLHVSPGTFIRIDGDRLEAWPSASGGPPGLQIDRVSGSVDAFSLIAGRIELARLKIEGVHLRLAPSGARGWRPVGTELEPEPEPATPTPDDAPIPGTRTHDVAQPVEWLGPLIALETGFRRVMSAPHAAGVLEFRDVTLSFLPEAAAGGGADVDRGALRLERLTGRLVHRRFGGGSDLQVEAHLSEGGRDRGRVELTGRRERDDSVRIVISSDAVDLAAGARYIRGIRADARVEGTLSGRWTYETAQIGSGRLELDVVIRRLRSAMRGADEAGLAIHSPRVAVSGALEITPQSATLRSVRVENSDSSLTVSGEVSRPLQGGSSATVDLAVRNLELRQARHLIGWLPEIERREAAAVLAPLKSGRLASLHAQGTATLSGWQALLAGRTRRLPRNFRVEAELADTVAWVADTNRIEGLAARLSWVDSRVEVRDANARLDGAPLPTLDLVIDGFPNFLAGDPALRRMQSNALPLVGLGALWESLRPRPDATDAVAVDEGTRVSLELETLVHPLFLWPMWDVSAAIEAHPERLAIGVKRATWAGVPIRGKIEWQFRPSERVSLRLVADRPTEDAAVPEHADAWAHGSFEVGPIRAGRWQQNRAGGRFVASGGRVRIRDLSIDLAPAGDAVADGSIDLSTRGRVPFRVNFGVEGGDASTLAKACGLSEHQVVGRLDGDGSFEGKLEPGVSFFDGLTGLLDLRAFDGEIRKVAGPVVALAEATQEIDSFDPRDIVPFERVDTLLEFSDGGMRSSAFSLDGPQVGVVASGGVELAVHDKTIDAQVFLFLFRKLDRVLGKIPILNRLLLGTDENLIAAAYNVTGRWSDPQVASIPLPSSAGPASQVLQGVPLFVMRGIRALGSLVRLDDDDEAEAKSGS